MKLISLFTIIACMAAMLVTTTACNCKCEDRQNADSADRETMFQVATLQSLMQGNYDGYITVGELRQHGDIGLGTFSRVNGEMIVLDGTVYQALADGTVRVADDTETVPFASVTRFDNDITISLNSIESLDNLTEQLNAKVKQNGLNLIYAARIEISGANLTVRSELSQDKPYRPLAEALATDQREFTYTNISGTVVAVCFPPFCSAENTPGWHFHFISADKKRGGHLLKLTTATPAQAQLDATTLFNMYLPADPSFNQLDLTQDLTSDIEKVEK